MELKSNSKKQVQTGNQKIDNSSSIKFKSRIDKDDFWYSDDDKMKQSRKTPVWCIVLIIVFPALLIISCICFLTIGQQGWREAGQTEGTEYGYSLGYDQGYNDGWQGAEYQHRNDWNNGYNKGYADGDNHGYRRAACAIFGGNYCIAI